MVCLSILIKFNFFCFSGTDVRLERAHGEAHYGQHDDAGRRHWGWLYVASLTAVGKLAAPCGPGRVPFAAAGPGPPLLPGRVGRAGAGVLAAQPVNGQGDAHAPAANATTAQKDEWFV